MEFEEKVIRDDEICTITEITTSTSSKKKLIIGGIGLALTAATAVGCYLLHKKNAVDEVLEDDDDFDDFFEDEEITEELEAETVIEAAEEV